MTNNDYEVFVKENYIRIFNYILKYVKNKEDAQDVLQDTFIKFYDKRKSIASKTKLAYLYKIAYSKSMDFLRKKQRMNNKEIPLIEEIVSDSATQQTQQPNDEGLKTALASLPEKLATVIQLKYFHKKSYKEIATEMQTTSSAIDSLLVRAKKKLRKIIQDSRSLNVL